MRGAQRQRKMVVGFDGERDTKSAVEENFSADDQWIRFGDESSIGHYILVNNTKNGCRRFVLRGLTFRFIDCH